MPQLSAHPHGRVRAETSASDAQMRLAASAAVATPTSSSSRHAGGGGAPDTPRTPDNNPDALTPCTVFFASGRCPRGSQCPFLHEVDGASPIASPYTSPPTSPRERSTSAPPAFTKGGESALRRLPVFTWTGPRSTARNSNSSNGSGKPSPACDDDDSRVCLICFEPFGSKPITALPCIHKFHAHCVFPWVRKQGTCPKCLLPVGGERTVPNTSLCRYVAQGRASAPAPASQAVQQVSRTPTGRFVMSTGGDSPSNLSSPRGLNYVWEALFGPGSGGVAWVKDSRASSTCMMCPARWGVLRRRHHCRSCGIVACSGCVSKVRFKGYTFNQFCCSRCRATYTMGSVVVPPWLQP